MVAKVVALVPKRLRPAGALAGLWLASELAALLVLASCQAEPVFQGAARIFG